jgi:hypothetical protein
MGNDQQRNKITATRREPMPRKAKGPRLWLAPARYRDGKLTHAPVWTIRDDTVKLSTGFGQPQRLEAELALKSYIDGQPVVRTYYIYFLTTQHPGFPIKIGITQNRFSRFEALQTALPYAIELLAIVPTLDPIMERKLQHQFRDTRLFGEWFERTPELLEMISQFASESGVSVAATD